MSTASYFIQEQLGIRSQDANPGIKRSAKRLVTRALRAEAKVTVSNELKLQFLMSSDVKNLSLREMDEYADWLLQAESLDEVGCLETEGLDPQQVFIDEGAFALPLHLQGALPDWMLDQLEAANGDAFASLSLFESKRLSPKAAISMEDELLYA